MAFDDCANVTDHDLMALYARGDRAAARALTQRFLPRAHAHAYRLLGDGTEAEDVAQEAMLRLWRIAPEWDPDRAQVSTWLYRVVANLATDRLRRRRGSFVSSDGAAETVADSAPEAGTALQEAARHRALRDALADLPERQRDAVYLRHFEERTNKEIAEVLSISVEAVESLLSRGRRALKLALSGRKDSLGYQDE